jgi:predicted O-methyltransferase YrrM
MRALRNKDGETFEVDCVAPPLPDDQLFVRFRSLIDQGIPNEELSIIADTRYIQPILYFLARTSHARTIVEIGAGRGGSFLPLLKCASEMGGKVCSVDPGAEALGYETAIAKRYGLESFHEPQHMTSDDFFACNGWPIDFAFVDGNHRCDFVMRDARNVLDRLVPGGYVVFHEYDVPLIPPNAEIPLDWQDDQLYQGGCDHGTPRALRKVLADYDVDTMPLDFGCCGLDRVPEWTEAGGIIVRKRRANEYRVKG